MDQGPLVDQQIEAGTRLIEALAHVSFDVTAAFWIKASEEGRWFLYIATKTLDEIGVAEAYRRVIERRRGLEQEWERTHGQRWFDTLDVKLISPTNPTARDVLDLQARYPDLMPIRYQGPRLGRVSLDDSYIYAPLFGVTTIPSG